MAYKVFTNGSPLPASDLNTYLMNQSVIVFADSTARSAALTAPTEGMVTYLEDTGLVYVYNGSSWVDINDNSGAIPKSTVTTAGDLIVADGSASVTRLGIGANGTFLSSNGTTATWASISGGGLTQLATGTLSGSEVIISSISQAYKSLILEMSNFYQTVAGDTYFTARNGTTPLDCNHVRTIDNGSTITSTGLQTTTFQISNNGASAAQAGSYTAQIWNYSSTAPKPVILFGSPQKTNRRSQISYGAYYTSSAINAIRVNADNDWSGGTYTLWGVN